jgi:hypothetical protein
MWIMFSLTVLLCVSVFLHLFVELINQVRVQKFSDPTGSNIRSAKGFEREKMIYIALIVRALFKRFGTKPFSQIWFRTYFREPFSHRFPFFVFATHYYTLIARWLSTIKNIVCFYLLEIRRPSYFFLFNNK